MLTFSISFFNLDPEATDEFNLQQISNFQWENSLSGTQMLFRADQSDHHCHGHKLLIS